MFVIDISETNANVDQGITESQESSRLKDLNSMAIYRSPLVTITVTTKYGAFITDMIMDKEEDAERIRQRLKEPSLIVDDAEKLSRFSCILEMNRVSLIHFGNERCIKLLMIFLYRYGRESCIASAEILKKFNINPAILKARPGETEHTSITGTDKLILALHHAFLCICEENIEISPKVVMAYASRLAHETQQSTQCVKVDKNLENQSIGLRPKLILEEVDDECKMDEKSIQNRPEPSHVSAINVNASDIINNKADLESSVPFTFQYTPHYFYQSDSSIIETQQDDDIDETILETLPRTTDPVRFLPDPFATLNMSIMSIYLNSTDNSNSSGNNSTSTNKIKPNNQ